jgi:autophagy-related protein 9
MDVSWDYINTQLVETTSIDENTVSKSVQRINNYTQAMIRAGVIKPLFLTQTTEWLINFVLKRIYFSEAQDGRINGNNDCIIRINHQLYKYGALVIIAFPFIFVSYSIYYCLKYTLQFKSNIRPTINIFSKEWNTEAKFKFREYWELPHQFEERLAKGYKYVIKYDEQFYSPTAAIIAKQLVIVVGGMISLFLIFSLIHEELLWNIVIFRHSLAWYGSILMVLVVILYSLIPTKYQIQRGNYLEKLFVVMPELPDRWLQNPNFHNTHKQLAVYFEHKILIGLKEMLSVFTVPYLLLWHIPYHTGAIISFYNGHTMFDTHVGYVFTDDAVL